MRISSFKNFESKVSEIKEDLEDILLDLEDNGFKYDITINDWSMSYNRISDASDVNWVNIEIQKEGKWSIYDIDETIIRLVNFFSIQGLYPTFDRNPKLDMETSVLSANSDIFKNRLAKLAGTTDTYIYDITFQ